VIAVNVIEHTESAQAFVQQLAAAVEPGGTLIIVCPDGERPWTELLIADHLWSFTAGHVMQLLARAGIGLATVNRAPEQLGGFVMITGSRARSNETTAWAPEHRRFGDAGAYLRTWRDLDATLIVRAGDRPLVCFGIGEAAGLLRAYAPRTWSQVSRCVLDAPERREFDGLGVDDYQQLSPRATILLGVRPSDQTRLAARIEADGHQVIRWDDLVKA
jgi:hypothetical protein